MVVRWRNTWWATWSAVVAIGVSMNGFRLSFCPGSGKMLHLLKLSNYNRRHILVVALLRAFQQNYDTYVITSHNFAPMVHCVHPKYPPSTCTTVLSHVYWSSNIWFRFFVIGGGVGRLVRRKRWSTVKIGAQRLSVTQKMISRGATYTTNTDIKDKFYAYVLCICFLGHS